MGKFRLVAAVAGGLVVQLVAGQLAAESEHLSDNLVANGGFELVDAAGKPQDWTLSPDAKQPGKCERATAQLL